MDTVDEEEDKKVVVNDMKNCFGFDVSNLQPIFVSQYFYKSASVLNFAF